MTTISKSATTLTLINTFKVAPDKQQTLIDLLDRATENVMRKQPGFHLGKHSSIAGRDKGRELCAVAQQVGFGSDAEKSRSGGTYEGGGRISR